MCTDPIAAVITPMKEAAVARAVEYAEVRLRELAQGWIGTDLNSLRPNARMSKGEYQAAQQHYTLATRLMVVQKHEGIQRMNTPVIAIRINPHALAKLVKEAGEDAALAFDAYVAKLSAKVGACDSATVEGPLWLTSVLTVSKGEKTERWSTKQIINVSSLGKLFNQWPTRLMK